MRVIIIDNETSVRKGLIALLGKHCPQVTEIFEATGVVDGIRIINETKPDLVFLDVEMDDGTGFELLNKLVNYHFQLVFITAHNKYAVDAFKFCAIDFLLKPIGPMELVISVNRALDGQKKQNLELQIKLLQEHLFAVDKNLPRAKNIALIDGNVIHYVKIEEIIFCKAEGAYTSFHLTNGKKILVSQILKEYDELLHGYMFIRTHHSYLVNSSKIVKYDKSDGGQLYLEDNYTIPVSARKKVVVLNILSNLR